MTRLLKFQRFTGDQRRLLVRSVLLLAATRISLWFLPYGVVRKWSAGLAALGKPIARRRSSTEEVAWAVHVADVLRFAANVECLGRFGLHAEAQFERVDHAFQMIVGFGLLLMGAVQLG